MDQELTDQQQVVHLREERGGGGNERKGYISRDRVDSGLTGDSRELKGHGLSETTS